MTQEDKELLLKDLCGRLPYGVIMTNKMLTKTYYQLDGNEWQEAYYDDAWDDVPYLRPLSSMTEEEIRKYKCLNDALDENYEVHIDNAYPAFDWLNENHFDYRGLIEKGLAIEVTEENNPYEKEQKEK